MSGLRVAPFRWAVLVALAWGSPAHAQQLAPEHGKLNTADATPVGAHVLEVEGSYVGTRVMSHAWGALERAPADQEHMTTLSLAWGPTDDWDFTALFGYGFVERARPTTTPNGTPEGSKGGHGLTDSALVARWRFLSTGSTDVATTTGFTLPTATGGASAGATLSQPYTSWDSALVTSMDSGAATTDVELRFSLPVGPARDADRGVAAVNAAGGYHVIDWLQPELEFNAARVFSKGPDAQYLAVTLGVVAPWGNGHRIMAGAGQTVWGMNTPAVTMARLAYKAAF